MKATQGYNDKKIFINMFNLYKNQEIIQEKLLRCTSWILADFITGIRDRELLGVDVKLTLLSLMIEDIFILFS